MNKSVVYFLIAVWSVFYFGNIEAQTISDQGPATSNWLEYLRKWVEEDSQPHEIIVSKLSGKDTVMTRPVFPYPSKTVYRGTGDPNDTHSFKEVNTRQ